MRRMPLSPPRTGGILVLHKTVDVLEALRQAPGGMALGALAQTLRMPKPTAFRILATLQSRGYLERTSTGSYRLGRKLFELGQHDTSEQDIIRAAGAPMESLLQSCRETLNLGVLDGGEVLVIETRESPLSVRMSSKIGNRRYAHSTALGKVLLAALPHEELIRILNARGMPRFTPHTIVTPEALIAELERVRVQGYACDNRENEKEGRCVAAPVYGTGKRVVAALSISGPLPRMSVAKAKSLTVPLLETCATISAGIGG
jgi:IclR family transcriptional regulator, KDG regulon repressor